MDNLDKFKGFTNRIMTCGLLCTDYGLIADGLNDFPFDILVINHRALDDVVSDTRSDIPLLYQDSNGDLEDLRVNKTLPAIDNIHDSIEDNETIDMRGIADKGRYDGIPFSYNHNIITFAANSLLSGSIAEAELNTELDELHERYASIGANYIHLLEPGEYEQFAYPPFPDRCFFASDTEALIGIEAPSDGYLIRGLLSGSTSDGTIDTASVPTYVYSDNHGVGIKIPDTKQITFLPGNIDTDDDILVVVNFIADWSSNETGVPLLDMSQGTSIFEVTANYTALSASYTFIITTGTGVSPLVHTCRPVVLNPESFHNLVVLISRQDTTKKIYVFLNGFLLDVFEQSTTFSSVANNITIAPDTDDTYIGNILIYDLGKSTSCVTSTWLDEFIPRKIANFYCNLYNHSS